MMGEDAGLRLPEEAAPQHHPVHPQRHGAGEEHRQGRGRHRPQLHLRLRERAPAGLHDGEERGAVRRHELRDRRHRPGQGRAQPRGREEVLRLADEPGRASLGPRPTRCSTRRTRPSRSIRRSRPSTRASSAGSAGEARCSTRRDKKLSRLDPKVADPRQRAPDQVRLREVRQGGGAQAPARAVREKPEAELLLYFAASPARHPRQAGWPRARRRSPARLGGALCERSKLKIRVRSRGSLYMSGAERPARGRSRIRHRSTAGAGGANECRRSGPRRRPAPAGCSRSR